MPINFTCPHCSLSTLVADQHAGETGPCPHCGQTITIPSWQGAATAPPAHASASSNWAMPLVAIVVGGFLFLFCGGLLAGLLLPAVQASREAARRMSCSNNLKQIALALHNYHDEHGSFPPAYATDANGNPTVSWRVILLPYLGQQSLYDQIDITQPWDAPANAALLNTQVPLYICPSSADADRVNTNYMVVTGQETLFPGEQTLRFADVVDGLSNTIAVVEVVGQEVHWASPEDLDYDSLVMALNTQQIGQMGSRHPGGIQVAFADGSVRFLSNTIDSEVLRALLTPAGDEQVAIP
jgi:prepilin-type processing-associated H-X9-DG protein